MSVADTEILFETAVCEFARDFSLRFEVTLIIWPEMARVVSQAYATAESITVQGSEGVNYAICIVSQVVWTKCAVVIGC